MAWQPVRFSPGCAFEPDYSFKRLVGDFSVWFGLPCCSVFFLSFSFFFDHTSTREIRPDAAEGPAA